MSPKTTFNTSHPASNAGSGPKYVVRFTTTIGEERKLYYIVNLSKFDKLGCPDQVLTTPYRKHAFVFCRLLNKQST